MGAHWHHRYGTLYVRDGNRFRPVRRGEPASDRYARFNAPLARRVLKWIKKHPETWQQDSWTNACGTAQCFAGHAAVMSGQIRLSPPRRGRSWAEFMAGRKPVYPGEVAQEILGLNFRDANTLFASHNTIEDLEGLVAHYCRFPYSSVAIGDVSSEGELRYDAAGNEGSTGHAALRAL